MKKQTLTLSLSLIFCVFSAVPYAAIQGEVDEKYQIPVPKEQKKISVEQTKVYQDGRLELTLMSAERTKVELLVGDKEVSLAASKLTLVEGLGGHICTIVYLGMTGKRGIVSAACEEGSEQLQVALLEQQNAEPVEVIDPLQLMADTEMGAMTNPYLGDSEAIAQGHKLFLANSCNGCHGGTGGGGMGPALSNGVWVYGKADDTLFRLIILGSTGLQQQGHSRIAREKVVGPMPAYQGIIEDADELWKIIAWVRSVSPTDAPAAK